MTLTLRPFVRLAAAATSVCLTSLAFAAPASVTVDGGWVRWLPGTLPAAGYLAITNTSDQPVDLVGTSSPDYGMTMLHVTRTEGSTSKMEMVDKLTVPAHQKVALEPGHYHLMLEQPTHKIAPGDTIRLELKFSNGETVVAPLPVKPPSATQ
ncbi:copper chaperone PCu(A)C [Pararobbsia silviterrae]|uniref:Copper chaperone PCu(A)C n=1 Tax=Pararobbsia silviterrae TaxID=1792498 RepID=A0A494Y0Z7_9BURK|nr:copper chaperone PCu(A)C [Pararobbsia silviterrae]RKP56434.1 copper chaperone PCu(A)C [Pararobbsia silviterrae]